MNRNPGTLGFAAPTFAGYSDTHIDVPCLERIDFDLIRDSSLLAEKLGFGSVWFADHLMLGRDWEILEAWTVLSAIAAITSRIKIGSLVNNALIRNPALFAKMTSTLDLVSKGRLIVGVGSGSIPTEMDAYGFRYPASIKDRVAFLDETIYILKHLWAGKELSHEGEFFQLRKAICTPSPVQKPHPPILIGTLSDSKLVHRSVARHANMYNTNGTIEQFKSRLSLLKDFCFQEHRQPSEISTSIDAHVLIGKNEDAIKELKRKIATCSPNYPSVKWKSYQESESMTWEDFEKFNFIGTAPQITEKLSEYMKAGCDFFTLWFLDLPSFEGMRLFAKEVMPNFNNETKR